MHTSSLKGLGLLVAAASDPDPRGKPSLRRGSPGLVRPLGNSGRAALSRSPCSRFRNTHGHSRARASSFQSKPLANQLLLPLLQAETLGVEPSSSQVNKKFVTEFYAYRYIVTKGKNCSQNSRRLQYDSRTNRQRSLEEFGTKEYDTSGAKIQKVIPGADNGGRFNVGGSK